MLFRQLYDAQTSTYTYLIADLESGNAALIDPVREQVDRDLTLVKELGLHLAYVLDTHTHADHVTGAGTIAGRTGARTVAGHLGAVCADVKVRHEDVIAVGALRVRVLATPGHTDDSVSYLVGEHVFTGDALLIRGCGRTDFQNGDAGRLYDSLTRVLFALPPETLVYPGHDYRGLTVSTIGEESRLNARVAGKTHEEFVAIMGALALPPPVRMAEAVPANRACGRTEAS